MSLVCLSWPANISNQERVDRLFLLPGQTAEAANIFGESVQRRLWVRNYGAPVRLRVQFMNEKEHEKEAETVRRVVREKLDNIMNVRFEFVSVDVLAQIRISFFPLHHSWSAIGSDAALVSNDDPTMNLSDLSDGNILHQFAHALGFPHENANDPSLRWDRGIIDPLFAQAPHFWNAEQTTYDFVDLANFDQFYNFHNFRRNSLMCPIWPCEAFERYDDRLTLCNREPLATDYTPEDKTFFLTYYPFGEETANGETVPPAPVVTIRTPTAPPIIEGELQVCTINHASRNSLIGIVVIVVLLVVWLLCVVLVK